LNARQHFFEDYIHTYVLEFENIQLQAFVNTSNTIAIAAPIAAVVVLSVSNIVLKSRFFFNVEYHNFKFSKDLYLLLLLESLHHLP
jgi:hypothetical protein